MTRNCGQSQTCRIKYWLIQSGGALTWGVFLLSAKNRRGRFYPPHPHYPPLPRGIEALRSMSEQKKTVIWHERPLPLGSQYRLSWRGLAFRALIYTCRMFYFVLPNATMLVERFWTNHAFCGDFYGNPLQPIRMRGDGYRKWLTVLFTKWLYHQVEKKIRFNQQWAKRNKTLNIHSCTDVLPVRDLSTVVWCQNLAWRVIQKSHITPLI